MASRRRITVNLVIFAMFALAMGFGAYLFNSGSDSRIAQAATPEYDRQSIAELVIKCDSVVLGQPVTDCDFQVPEELRDAGEFRVSVNLGEKQNCSIGLDLKASCLDVLVPNQVGVFDVFLHIGEIKYETAGATSIYDPADVIADMVVAPAETSVINQTSQRVVLQNLILENQNGISVDDLKCDFYGMPKESVEANSIAEPEWVLLESGVDFTSSGSCAVVINSGDLGQSLKYDVKVNLYSARNKTYRFPFYVTIYSAE